MCGIYGQFSFGDRIQEADKRVCNRALEMMKHRGPDDEGVWTNGQDCILGFRRLSILDLSPSGHQPMVTANGRYVLIFNGEIYNFKDIRAQLESTGIHITSSGDAEVVLHALATWGVEALKKMLGMFALAFFDQAERRLLLARDHAGIKPLYVLQSKHGIVFASQYDQILSHPWSQEHSLSPDGLALYLRLGYIPAPYAALRNSAMIEPGSWLEAGKNKSIQKGFFFTFPKYAEPNLFGEEAYEAVDAAITNAVKRHLVSDVPVGTFLSGGIDSPLVAAKMVSAGSPPAHAYTIGVTDPEMDESEDARAYAAELGLDHVWQQVKPDDGTSLLWDVVRACGEPLADVSIFPTFIVSRLASKQMKVILSGDGGDELFWGYAGRFASILRKSQDFRRPHWLRSARWGLKKFFNMGDGYLNLRFANIGDWYRTKHSKMSENTLAKLMVDPPAWPDDFSLFKYEGWEEDKTAQWLRWNEFIGHLTMVLLKVDRASMYHSLEVRVPFLDREVVETALRVDWHTCLERDPELGKIPLRRSLSRHIRHQSHTKRGFDVPMNQWLRGPFKKILMECLLGRGEILGVRLRASTIEKSIQEHMDGTIDHSPSLWNLLSLSLWEQHHFLPSRATDKAWEFDPQMLAKSKPYELAD